ncbi:unnamed protein product [Danaus chrysippus]|uniref:(African queen) hypothetical protein n=1 Tax=Danaus chrysippus TaxID=151541 RepID=A0A8J2VQ51_9NEOP|nr:unnamed protein product [Danaus chrysippus]
MFALHAAISIGLRTDDDDLQCDRTHDTHDTHDTYDTAHTDLKRVAEDGWVISCDRDSQIENTPGRSGEWMLVKEVVWSEVGSAKMIYRGDTGREVAEGWWRWRRVVAGGGATGTR